MCDGFFFGGRRRKGVIRGEKEVRTIQMKDDLFFGHETDKQNDNRERKGYWPTTDRTADIHRLRKRRKRRHICEGKISVI